VLFELANPVHGARCGWSAVDNIRRDRNDPSCPVTIDQRTFCGQPALE
jgi:hypothetical protein